MVFDRWTRNQTYGRAGRVTDASFSEVVVALLERWVVVRLGVDRSPVAIQMIDSRGRPE